MKSLRMCCNCRKMFYKDELIRIVRNKENLFLIDKTKKINGRGAYICSECRKEDLKKRKVLNKSFKCNVPENIYDDIKVEEC